MKRIFRIIELCFVVACLLYAWKYIKPLFSEEKGKELSKSTEFLQDITGFFDSKTSGMQLPRSTEELLEIDESNSFSYTCLDEQGKIIYAQLFTGIENREKKISIEASTNEEISAAVEAVLADHPEFFWISGNSTIWSNQNDSIKEIELEYNIAEEEIDSIKAQIEEIANRYLSSWSSEASDYDKIRAVYEYVILNTDYNLESVQNQNIQSVFLNGQSVCAGYAKAVQYLLHRAGIFCAYLSGNVRATGEYHAWNMVFIDGNYYYLDATWGDPTYSGVEDDNHDEISYDYLCITTEELFRTHIPDKEGNLPICDSTEYDYYYLQGRYFTQYDSYILELLNQDVYNQNSESFLKFSNAEAYNQAKEDLFTMERVQEPAKLVAQLNDLAQYGCSYYLNDNYYIIKIEW